MENRKKCIRCGALLPQEASFCPCCTASQLAREPMSPPRSEKRRGALACAVLLVVLIGAVLWATLGGRAAQTPPRTDGAQTLEPADPTEPTGLSGNYQSGGCQTWYDGADGRMYHLYVCFSPQSDGGGLPASHRSELLPADASGTSPLCLFVEGAEDPSLDVREDFSALLAYHTVEAVAAEGSDTCTILGETDSYYNAGALLAHEHEVTSACTYNDIIWTLHMKTGDKITLRQVEECSEKQRRTVSWEDTPMDTTADLQALLDDLTLNLNAETELVVELPNVTYTEPLTIRRAMTLQAHADGTEFTAPITVNHMAYSEVTDIHVVLSGLRLCGAGDMTGTGVTAKAPTYLNNCWITNWDVGALAADGGWIWVEKSSFTRNATALRTTPRRAHHGEPYGIQRGHGHPRSAVGPAPLRRGGHDRYRRHRQGPYLPEQLLDHQLGRRRAGGGRRLDLGGEKQLHPQRHGSAHRHHGELLLGR